MKLIRLLLAAIPAGLAGICVTVTISQAAMTVWLWADGKLTERKLVRYAAVLYGLDLTEIPADEDDSRPQDEELLTREELLKSRVHQSELIADRIIAVERTVDSIRIIFENLRSDSDRYEQMKSRFDAHLAQLELNAREAAIQELQRTLETLQPKQAKNLLLLMLEEHGRDPDDDVLQDVVTIIKSMPKDKRRRILGEFKTDQERQRLHEILLEIGELDAGG